MTKKEKSPFHLKKLVLLFDAEQKSGKITE